jgi:nitric oxide dioxygenase
MEPFDENLNKLIVFPEGGINSKVLAKSDNFNHTLMCIAKGADIDTHTSTKNGGVYVIKGNGTFKLFDKEIKMEPGTYIFMPANAPHSLKAETDLAMLLCLSD